MAALAASRAIHRTPFEHHRRNQGREDRSEKKIDFGSANKETENLKAVGDRIYKPSLTGTRGSPPFADGERNRGGTLGKARRKNKQ
jgi:hypothetical protein